MIRASASSESDRQRGREGQLERSGVATLALLTYVAVTLVLTWPLAAGLTHDVAGDFGDPLFSSWAIAWGATHLGPGWWSANIYAPHPLALAYSEHFVAQALQAMPIYAATRNPILCYNLLFLSTFVLSAWGMFLFARELTCSDAAAFVAGLAFAFTPYRIAAISHLQVLSSAWMPFVLFGIRRWADTGRTRALAGAAAAWILQNLSCGYYLLFFSPIAALYLAWELWRTGRWRDRRSIAQAAAACVAVAAATVPFLLPYLELRRLGFNPRSLAETRRFSADVYAYLTADPGLKLWGRLFQAWPRAEGLLFPGITIAALAGIGAGRPAARGIPARPAIAIASVLLAVLVVALLFGYSMRLPGVRITSLPRVLMAGALASCALLAASRPARRATAAWLHTPAALFTIVVLFAVAMSFGPDIHAKGRSVAAANIYSLFYAYVPGFDGLRVPARFATIAALALAALAALAVAAIDPRRQRHAALISGALIVAEAFAVPIPTNQNSTVYTQPNLAPLPASVATGDATPAVYTFVATLPASTALLELPLGEPAFDIRYMFYSTRHWRRLVNGYSGGAPPEYDVLTEALKDADGRPDRAWELVTECGATHAVVHEALYTGDHGRRLSDWLRARGARELAAIGSDRVFLIR